MAQDVSMGTNPRTLVARLRSAREARGWTQQQAAEALGIARTTMVAMEAGERRVKPEEIARLAQLYHRKLSELVREDPPIEGFAVQLRATLPTSGPVDAELLPAIEELQGLCEDYLRLEKLCGAPLPRRYPPPYDIDGLEPEMAGEDVASSERRRLGLGLGPLLNLREALESDVGLRVFQPAMPSKLAGMFAFSDELGGCIAVNRKHPRERRQYSLAHEFGHFLADRHRWTMHFVDRYDRRPRSERFADAFARALLMPAEGIRRRFLELQKSRDGAVVMGDLCRLARAFAVSVEAMTLRLENLHLIPTGVWERMRADGFRVREAEHLLGLAPLTSDDELLPSRYIALAVEAWQRATLSEGQLVEILRTDRLSVRERLREIDQPEAGGGLGSQAFDLSHRLVAAANG